ncbi:hypothetical protein F383_09081 [Gossypium arboreum]|nr:hypothetical protein F383_09081 [Gossypium arboreum]
MLTKLS